MVDYEAEAALLAAKYRKLGVTPVWEYHHNSLFGGSTTIYHWPEWTYAPIAPKAEPPKLPKRKRGKR